ncbi:MAG: hypothetical protein JJ975_00350 [Bacteroidia bacterium]|nr:hypothetical protein [Bacteroidia bacterium]
MSTININRHTINLDLPPGQRWQFLKAYQGEMKELFSCYLKDFEGADYLLPAIDLYKAEVVSQEYLEEIESIALLTGFTPNETLLANLYYDVLKAYLGCTAFAHEANGRMFHSRNLDWWTDHNILSKHSMIFDFQREGRTCFSAVGWPGFIGVLSGVKSGAFSLTLNAVLGTDSAELATPVTFLLRDVLDQSGSFSMAKEVLENKTIASDCLLLLSGTSVEEMAVIERSPKRSAVRTSDAGHIAVTNDYKLLKNELDETNPLQSTSCARYDRAMERLKRQHPMDPDQCFSILQDQEVMMGITVQQMVFDTIKGDIYLKTTNT